MKRVNQSSSLALCFGFLFTISASAQSGLRVMPESAIPFTAFLSKADFDQRFPGDLKADPSKLDSGWYVIYQHESLSYYFGPILLESIGEDYLGELEKIVEEAVQKRPSIQDYELVLRYEPSLSQSNSSQATSSTQKSEPSTSSPQQTGQPPSQPSSSIWTIIRSIFGF